MEQLNEQDSKPMVWLTNLEQTSLDRGQQLPAP